MKYLKYYLMPFFSFILVITRGQTIPIGQPIFDENLRILQLEGKLDPHNALTARPYFLNKTLTADSLIHLIDPVTHIHTLRYSSRRKTSIFEWLPITLDNQYNSHHPYGWNTAGMIDAKGFQNKFSTGLFASFSILSVQLKPEIVYAQNPDFEYSAQYGAPTKGVYTKIFAGQSSIRLSAAGLSLGVSTENMWWGPGIQNSLLMSNNAPGFLHLTFNSTKPLKTAIGYFEFQLIAGKLVEDTNVLLENKDLISSYYAQNNYGGFPSIGSLDHGGWRYFNGVTVSYNPKWIKQLFLGFNRTGLIYHDSLGQFPGFIHNYLPVFVEFFRSSSTYQSGSLNLKQTVSISARYLLPKSHTEVYAEYGANDNTFNIRDELMSPNHGTAFTIGVKKLYPLKKNKWLSLEGEITQLSQSVDQNIRSTGYWYLFQGGYTNQSRILGAGYGMGSNMQSFTCNLLKGFNNMGFLFQRIVHDPNPDTSALSIIGKDMRFQLWRDNSLGIFYRKQVNRLSINILVQGIRSRNYAWLGNTRYNFHGFITLSYIL